MAFRKTTQGLYSPINEKKYSSYGGKKRVDVRNIVYRSSWERVFMKYCDTNPNILNWGSEESMIPYLSPLDNKVHRYFPDFWIRYKSGDNIYEAFVEIKPFDQTVMPKNPKSRSYKEQLATYLVNQAKWKYAREFCAQRNLNFIIITERELFNKKGK